MLVATLTSECTNDKNRMHQSEFWDYSVIITYSVIVTFRKWYCPKNLKWFVCFQVFKVVIWNKQASKQTTKQYKSWSPKKSSVTRPHHTPAGVFSKVILLLSQDFKNSMCWCYGLTHIFWTMSPLFSKRKHNYLNRKCKPRTLSHHYATMPFYTTHGVSFKSKGFTLSVAMLK